MPRSSGPDPGPIAGVGRLTDRAVWCVVLWRRRARTTMVARPRDSEGVSVAGSRSARQPTIARRAWQTRVRGWADRARLAIGYVAGGASGGRGHGVAVDVAAWLRVAQPAPQRLPALLHDRQPRRDPDPGAPPA